MFTRLRVLVALAVVAAGLVAVELVREAAVIRRLSANLQAAEAAHAEAEGLIVGERRTQRALLAEVEALNDQLEAVRKVAGKVEVREVIRWRTGELAIPLPEPAPRPPGEPEPLPGEPAAPTPCPTPRIALAGVEARVVSRAGNLFAVGQVEVTRTFPLPAEVVGTLPWESGALSIPAPETTRVRWSFGPAVGVAGGKAVFGAFATTPAIRLWRVEARPLIGAQANLDGDVSAQVALLFGIRR